MKIGTDLSMLQQPGRSDAAVVAFHQQLRLGIGCSFLATLLYLGKLPSVWIPPSTLRDERELPRTRMTFAGHRTRVKNRISSTLAKFALSLDTASDIFTAKWRPDLLALLVEMPAETARKYPVEHARGVNEKYTDLGAGDGA